MINLDKLPQIEKLDKDSIRRSITELPDQIIQTIKDIKELEIPEDFASAKNIVICGMGGSALGGRIVDALITDRMRVPIEVFTEIKLPNYVNADSLVILSSYSGNTEETLLCAEDALKRKAKIFIITTGGKLAEFATKEKKTAYVFKPRYNYSRQPRMALGYAVFALLAVLRKLDFITFSDKEIDEAITRLKGFIWEYSPEVLKDNNLAKFMTYKLRGRLPILIASEHVSGAAHAFKNQLNENSKTFSALFDIPELNHHLMEGLKFPAVMKSHLFFLFFHSEHYSIPVQKRYPITQEVIQKNGIEWGLYKLSGVTKLEDVLQLLAFSEWTSFYLAMTNEVDPGPIPWVDYFKEKLL